MPIGKMENIRSISTNTLTNDFCKKMNATKNNDLEFMLKLDADNYDLN